MLPAGTLESMPRRLVIGGANGPLLSSFLGEFETLLVALRGCCLFVSFVCVLFRSEELLIRKWASFVNVHVKYLHFFSTKLNPNRSFKAFNNMYY